MDSVKTLVEQLGKGRLAVIIGATMCVLAGLIVIAMHAARPQMAFLYTDLEPSSAQSIAEKLKAQGIPFEVSADGRTMRAPENRLGEIRIMLAGEQLGGPIGYELFDKQDLLGTTSFLQQVNHVRAMEGELARTIESIQTVESARVHLVLPQQQLFEQEKRRPSAAITLRTRGQLPASKVNAIRYLVSSAVPDLEPGRISVVDQTGTLLARADGDANSSVSDSINEKQTAVEQKLRSQVEAILERIVGPGHVRAEVSAELDRAEVREQAEVFDPDKQVVARSTTVEKNDQNKDQQVGGPVSVANNLPENQPSTSSAGGSESSNAETSEQLDYQNSKKMTTTIHEAGSIKRLSIAVLVDGNYNKSKNGKSTYTARSAEEIEQLKKLVENAVGYNAERGDSVEVINLKFAQDQDLADLEAKSSFHLSSSEIIKLIQSVFIIIAFLVIVFVIIKPLMKQTARTSVAFEGAGGEGGDLLEGPEERLALAPPPYDPLPELLSRAASGDEEAIKQLEARRQSTGLAIESEIDVAQIEGRLKSAAVRKVGEVIERNPQEASAVIRQWLYS